MSDEVTSEPEIESQVPAEPVSDEPLVEQASDHVADVVTESDREPVPVVAPALVEPIVGTFSDEVLNAYFVSALHPISDEFPCGEDETEASSVISRIETASDDINVALRTAFGEAVREGNTSSFDMAGTGREAHDLLEQVIECLESKCKSIVLASYLPHLLLIGHGPEGFDAGVQIFRELVVRYGTKLFPAEQDKLSGFLRRGVYVGNDDKVTDNYKLFLYLPITENEQLPYALLRNSRLKNSNPEIEDRYARDARASSCQFYVRLINHLNGAIESSRQANSALAKLLDESVIELVNFGFIESLERMVSIIDNLATDNCPDYPPVEEGQVLESEASNVGGNVATTGEITSREQAIELLRRIGDFFHRTERHSPISYRIRDTIRWCDMDLPELMQELLNGDEGPLSEMRKRVGFAGTQQLEQESDNKEQ